MKFGYARVSTHEQNLDIQVEKLKQAGCEKIFAEKISGTNDERIQLNLMLDMLREGDVVHVVRLDRLGRRMIKLVELINRFKEKGVEFISLENNIDTTTPIGMLLFNMCAAFSEMERELIRERVIAGIKSAAAKGRKGGRPKALTEKQVKTVLALKQSNKMSVKEICETIGISRSSYYRCINNKIEEMET